MSAPVHKSTDAQKVQTHPDEVSIARRPGPIKLSADSNSANGTRAISVPNKPAILSFTRQSTVIATDQQASPSACVASATLVKA